MSFVALILFPADSDVEAHVSERLIPTLEGSEGIESVVVSAGTLMSPAGPSPYGKAVVATFRDIQSAMGFAQSPTTAEVRQEGEALGVNVTMFETS